MPHRHVTSIVLNTVHYAMLCNKGEGACVQRLRQRNAFLRDRYENTSEFYTRFEYAEFKL